MADSQTPHGSIIAGINVTPLVDITLVLLIIFMVTAKIIELPGLDVDLPKAAQGTEVQVILSVIVSPVHPMMINGIDIRSDKEFIQAATQALAQHPDVRAVIAADGSMPHREVVHILDLLRQSGISRVAFATTPETLVEP